MADLVLTSGKDLGKLVKNEDPYERIISVHNTPPFWDGGAEAPQWSTGTVFIRNHGLIIIKARLVMENLRMR